MAIDVSKLKEKFDKKTSERTDRFNLQDGDNYLRILPPSIEYFSGDIDYISFEYLTHFNLGVEGDRKAEVCPKSNGKAHKCPICEAVYKLYKNNTPEDKEMASSLRAKTRFIFNVLDLNAVDKGVQVLEVGPKIYEYIITFLANTKWGDLLDLDKGRNFTITKTAAKETSSGYVEYSVTPDPDMTSIREKLPKNYKELIAALKKQVPVPKTYEELKAILEGEEVEEKKSVTKEETSHTAQEPVVEEKKPPKPAGEKPACFGEEYGPKADKCVKCGVKDDCRKKFLEL